jgi:hypothetical protein
MYIVRHITYSNNLHTVTRALIISNLNPTNFLSLLQIKASNYLFSVGYEVFAAVTMKNAVFWCVAPCRSCVN